ncbi:MAG: type VI secretion protein [Pandoraea sp.]|uniref:Type VI secretion protein n=1 Tax=Trinickia dabaoshanensis TaxID=564714 RepID=A0A2N7VI40_9BURK|nr:MULTISPECIES: TrbC/VirB2 family protein [Burkholderiaceae]PMS16797.1 type VI secretion protein [Trinickia dabaoshanensis]TAM18603.1 MAG: type VI secretion protein [Pandoraea sp.]TAM55345.1 MAG: type VI secretion protein [Paraburkholderia sp.]
MKLGTRIKAWLVYGSRRSGPDRQLAGTISVMISALFVASPAWAQLSQVNTLLSTIQTTLLGVGGVICSISIIWAGFRMMFQHARFGDIANVFIGGLFVGCATVIAGMLIPAGG